MKLTIELPDVVNVTRGTKVDGEPYRETVKVEMANMPKDIITRLVEHGIVQKIGDSAAGKPADKISEVMTDTRDMLYAGNWGRERSAGEGEPAINRFIRGIVRKALTGDNKTAYAAVPSDDQPARNAFLWERFESLTAEQQANVTAAAEAEMAEAAARRKQATKLAGGLGL